MENSQKRFSKIILIVAVVILAGALGYVTTVKRSAPAEQQTNIVENNQVPLPETTATTNLPVSMDVPTDWKTYTNSRYGFELKYPPNIRVTDSTTGALIANWSIRIFHNPQKLDFSDWFNSYFYKNLNKDCILLNSNIKIGNYKSYFIDATAMPESCDNAGYYALSDDNLRIAKLALGQDPQPYGDVFKILSTFKFITLVK